MTTAPRPRAFVKPAHPSDQPVREIAFANGNTARAVAATARQEAAEVLRALGLGQPAALLLVFGGADSLDVAVQPRLFQLFSRGLARAALTAAAAIIDGGTQAGVMALMGQGVAGLCYQSVLLGVAPRGLVTYPGGPAAGSIPGGAPLDPNHSHFVLVETDQWGGEIETMFALAEALADRALDAAAARPVPVVGVLAGGGEGSKQEVLQSVRRGWPVLVIEDSGALADRLATAWTQRPAFVEDPVVAEVVAGGDLHLFPLDGSVNDLALQLLTLFKHFGDNALLP